MDSAVILAAYKAAPDAWLQSVLLVEYRCHVQGCLLLHIWQSPAGAMYYRPPGPLPEASGLGVNQRLPAHGGLLTDFDTSGAQSGWGDDIALGVHFNGLVLGCGDLYGLYDAANFVADARSARPGRPIKRNDIWGHREAAIPSPPQRKRRQT